MIPVKVQSLGEPTVLSDGQHSGFPSPADDYLHRPLDLNEKLVPHPTSTFFVQVSGQVSGQVSNNSTTADRIFEGDILIVDRAEDCRDGHLVLAIVENQFVLRKLRKFEGKFWLCPSEPDQPSMELDESCEVWGRVMWSLTRH